jgi:8-oxo-dGTP pyrophosphatase MutT (NUDIX family)
LDAEELNGRRPGGGQLIPRPDVWAPGPVAPWFDRHDPARPISVEAVLAAVRTAGGPRPFAPPAGSKPSAVLVALLDGPQGAEVLLTRRGWHLRNHRGEVSFPGGRMDPGETPVDTALREAFEEVTLEPAAVEVHGELDHLRTVVSESYIVPVVGRLAERPELRPGTSEVDRIMFVPLVELTRPDTHREERWGIPPNQWPIHFFELDDETIWGATARVLTQLLSISFGVG